LFGAPRHVRGLKTDAPIKTAPKPKNKDYYHFTPISGQGSALVLKEGFRNLALYQTEKRKKR